MIYITGFMIKYHCSNCKHIALVEMQYSGINDLRKILNLGQEDRRCPACNADKFRMVQAMIKRSLTDFGDPSGMWACPTHRNERFYPIALERAFAIVSGRSDGVVMEIYKTIARNGFPLKCPKCAALLQYFRGGCYSNYGIGY